MEDRSALVAIFTLHLHQAEFGDRIYASPALAGDKFYLRTKSALCAFGEALMNKKP